MDFFCSAEISKILGTIDWIKTHIGKVGLGEETDVDSPKRLKSTLLMLHLVDYKNRLGIDYQQNPLLLLGKIHELEKVLKDGTDEEKYMRLKPYVNVRVLKRTIVIVFTM